MGLVSFTPSWKYLHYQKPLNLRILESKCSFGLVGCNASGDLYNVVIEFSTNMIEIAEDEGLLWVESTSNDVFCVLTCEFSAFFDSQVGLEQKLFIV